MSTLDHPLNLKGIYRALIPSFPTKNQGGRKAKQQRSSSSAGGADGEAAGDFGDCAKAS